MTCDHLCCGLAGYVTTLLLGSWRRLMAPGEDGHIGLDLILLAISSTVIRAFTTLGVGMAAAILFSLVLSQNHLVHEVS